MIAGWQGNTDLGAKIALDDSTSGVLELPGVHLVVGRGTVTARSARATSLSIAALLDDALARSAESILLGIVSQAALLALIERLVATRPHRRR
eukprot:944632-Rhodomonas_salina.1